MPTDRRTRPIPKRSSLRATVDSDARIALRKATESLGQEVEDSQEWIGRIRWGDEVTVPFEQCLPLVTELPRLLPLGAPFAFNHDGRRSAYFRVGEGIDLSEYLPFALHAYEIGKLACACCGFLTLDLDAEERTCEVCYWIDDHVQYRNPDARGGANEESLIEARENFARFGASLERFKQRSRAPTQEEIPPWR